MSTSGEERPRRRSPEKVVISSVTGKPIAWEDEPEDGPEPGAEESNDARIAGDVPPHWGRGR
ncbi:hypothetical protein [Brachybacterium sp. YJGR34]|uniref:hypothetical protein n=1 Tax=Brachybacterium sp. YJGR34 TaxID=2059911 RepID=UPI000E0C5C22|nr:hypothetical protein [Brachybacterium sp. YJGR34]